MSSKAYRKRGQARSIRGNSRLARSPSTPAVGHFSQGPATGVEFRKFTQGTPIRKLNQPNHNSLSTPLRRVALASSPSQSIQEPRPVAETDAAVEDREANDSLLEIVMALDVRERGTVGCSYYVAREETLYTGEDVKFGGIEIVDGLKAQAQPTTILLCSRADESIDEHLNPDGGDQASVNGEVNQFRLPYVFDVRPSPEFGFETSKRKLVEAQAALERSSMDFIAPGDGDFFDDGVGGHQVGFTDYQGMLLRLSVVVDFESRLSIGCAGAILTYLQRRRSAQYLPGDVDAALAFRVAAIKAYSLKDTMFINADTLASLQILKSESHPNSHNQGPTGTSSGSKEDLSVYGLFHHNAGTPQGKYLLRQYFLRPSLDVEVINERLDTASVFLKPENYEDFRTIVKSLRQIKNMKTVMIHLRKGINNGAGKGGGFRNGVWSSLRAFAFHALEIRSALSNIAGAQRLRVIMQVLELLKEDQLSRLGREVTRIIDFQASADMHRTIVNPGVDEQLDRMKRNYDGIEDLLNEASREIAATIPHDCAIDLNVIFFPQIGFLISMKADESTGRSDYEGGEDDDAWECIFTSPARAYYKDRRMQEFDERIGDMYSDICDREIDILYELAQRVLEYEDMLNAASDICGELDSLLALAQGASALRLTRPRISSQNVIQIIGGRHILQEFTVPTYVPNDTFLVGGPGYDHKQATRDSDAIESPQRSASTSKIIEGPGMLIMTGPNYSGKSVYLKQIALIVYMAHVGCFVPADSAVIGLTDKILTRISTKESVSKTQSSFMIDLQQISSAIRLASHRSLVIIDEFGKGTDSNDGAGLVCGVFEHLLGLGDNRPKVIGATHFHEIFENGFLKSRPQISFGHMEVRVNEDATDVENQITYLYNFRSGRSISSFGSVCAALNGIDPAVVNRAEDLISLTMRGEDLVAVCAAKSLEEMELLQELRLAESTARSFLSTDLKKHAGDDTGETSDNQIRDLLKQWSHEGDDHYDVEAGSQAV